MGPKLGSLIGGFDLVASITGNHRCQALKVLKYTGIGQQGAKSEECLVMATGRFTVSTRDASGLSNPAVWVALARKGQARTDGPIAITLTAEGHSYDTGFGDRFLAPCDH